MKITQIHPIKAQNPVLVSDCSVEKGYRKVAHGSLPDIDSDFDADRKDDVKAYLERRYNKNGKQRVFSAGTFTTMKIRSVIKDVARTYRVPLSITNYITTILDSELTWTGLMKVAVTDKRVRDFIQKYPKVFEAILPLMNQSRSAGIHASAIIIIPEYVRGKQVECFDILPIRKMGDILVSEISGNDIDAIGILKNDVLGLKELTRLSEMLQMLREEYGVNYTILEIASKYLNDPKVFETIKAGNTQGLFQLSGDGMTKFIKRMQPDNINDLIASVALYRPAPLASGSTGKYVDCKRGIIEPSYLWGTYNAMSNTLGILCYQEQLAMIACEVGGFSMGDGVKLIKLISKKHIDKIKEQKEKFISGALKNGCPIDAAEAIWKMFEVAGTYLFNASHATTYGLTAYVGAWLKTYYPTVFYTVVLKDQKEESLAILLNEIENADGASLAQPDINISGSNFVPDFKNNCIYWSLSRIKQLGPKAVAYIENERKLYGRFFDMEDFIKRIFKSKFQSFDDEGTEEARMRCPVTARSVRNLIFAGAFDRCEKLESIEQRYGLLEKAAELLGFEMSENVVPDEYKDKTYYWSQQQIALSGMGQINYKTLVSEAMETPNKLPFIDFKDLSDMFYATKKGNIAATITSVTDKAYKDKRTGERKHFGKIELLQNTYTSVLTIWGDWAEVKPLFKDVVGKILVATVNVKWSDFDDKNTLEINKSSLLKFI